MRLALRWLCAALALAIPAPGACAEPDPPPAPGASAPEAAALSVPDRADEPPRWPLPLTWEGSLGLGSSLSYAQRAPARGAADARGISRLRSELELAAQLELSSSAVLRVGGHAFRDFAYALKGRGEFTPQQRERYESELELDEAWLRLSPRADLDVTLGRQIAAFGSAELLRVVDRIGPLDDREPGLVELEHRRLPVAMTRVDWFRGPLRATALAVHESRADKQPVHGSDFYPPQLGPRPARRPASGGRDTGYGLVLARSFAGLDAALYHSRFREPRPHLGPGLVFEQARLNLLGASLAAAAGAWVVKGEWAALRGLQFSATRDERFARSDALLGLEYSGLRDTQLSFEVALRHLHDFDERLELAPDSQRRDSAELSLRWMRSLGNDRFQLALLASAFGLRAQDGLALRVSLAYAPRDALRLELGALIFRAGDRPPFAYWERNDRLFVAGQYHF